ncbi:NfeD family protein [Imhoffiella purpurea]|uniref:Putative membrane-bound ClpP-class protease n=1 Tax=Imhoffiella purpurea TaxID=1249627 RepID=W9VGN8_9GAMM|nr:nodulation protein NfeD [Imhoffiella purpurea]EXJ16176.1 Putative membrane-bound ClpP-class protease [Imhoffiella purpurea]
MKTRIGFSPLLPLLWAAALVLGAIGAAADGAPDSLARKALVLEVRGVIGPAMASYVADSIAEAQTRDAELVILRMDTPGGLDPSMRSIIQSIAASSVPVVGYVAPTGARAASAGTYILYACQIAAMAPGTNLGAATPVRLGGLPTPKPASEPENEEGARDGTQDAGSASSPEPSDAKERKLINDAAAYIRALASLHGRNADWAERAVREGASLSAEEALEAHVIDLMAPSLETLLRAIDGRAVRLGETRVVLDTSDLEPIERRPDWKTRLLAVIGHPNVAYILMLVGIYGLIYEFSNPGAVLPGTLGTLSLLLALYAFQVLPINYAGVGLIILGLALMAMELITPSFGALGLGGIAAFILGSLILIDSDAPALGISLPLVLGLALFSALVIFLALGLALRAHRRPVTTGAEELAGAQGEVVGGFPGSGSVRLHGEIWSASSDRPIVPGTRIRVVRRDGLRLTVEPIHTSPTKASKPS